jgi:hypothetical protein
LRHGIGCINEIVTLLGDVFHSAIDDLGPGGFVAWVGPIVEALGKLLVAASYNTRKHRAKSTKTDVVRHVPVHPTLAAMLAE